VFFIDFDAIMKDYAVGFAPECATLEAVETLGALLVAISTLYANGITLFDCQHIKQVLIRKLVGRSLRFPLGTLLSLLHSGQVMISWQPLTL